MGEDDGKRLLEGAYDLGSPEQHLAYYRRFSSRYDTDFAKALGYSLAATVAEIYRGRSRPVDVPVADIGCGTGLVGAALGVVVDGIDLSPEMLDQARHLGVYRALYPVDLTADLSSLPNDYGAIVSAGTFTHGHLGPEIMRDLLELGRDGALFVIGVNAAHYVTRGFEAELQQLKDAGLIGPVSATEVPIYRKAGHDHAGDRALVLVWRTTAQMSQGG